MRILFWSEAFWPYVGGVERFLERLAPGLRERGHELRILTAHGELTLPDDDVFEGIPVRRVPLFAALRERRPEPFFELQRRVAGFVDGFRPELIHANVQGPGVQLLARAASGAALVVTVHATFERLRSARSDTALGQALAQARWVTACSQVALDRLLVLSPEVRDVSSVIPMGVEIPKEPAEPVAAGGPERLLYVGRLVPMKGVDVALEAVARLRPAWPRLRLTVAGDGSERARLEAQARAAGIDDIVAFVGWRSEQQIAELTRQATLVVLPSRVAGAEYTEGLSLAALEAAALGRAVVACRAGGLVESVRDGITGLLVAPDDPAALAAAIDTLLADPPRAAAMGRAGREHVARRFGWPACLQAFDALFSRVLSEGRRSR